MELGPGSRYSDGVSTPLVHQYYPIPRDGGSIQARFTYIVVLHIPMACYHGRLGSGSPGKY